MHEKKQQQREQSIKWKENMLEFTKCYVTSKLCYYIFNYAEQQHSEMRSILVAVFRFSPICTHFLHQSEISHTLFLFFAVQV